MGRADRQQPIGTRPQRRGKAGLAISTALATVGLMGYGTRGVYAGSCFGGAGTYNCISPASGSDVT